MQSTWGSNYVYYTELHYHQVHYSSGRKFDIMVGYSLMRFAQCAVHGQLTNVLSIARRGFLSLIHNQGAVTFPAKFWGRGGDVGDG